VAGCWGCMAARAEEYLYIYNIRLYIILYIYYYIVYIINYILYILYIIYCVKATTFVYIVALCKHASKRAATIASNTSAGFVSRPPQQLRLSAFRSSARGTARRQRHIIRLYLIYILYIIYYILYNV